MSFAGFKKYIEEMDPSPEKKSEDEGSESTPVGNDYIDTLEDEFGIKWKDLSLLLASEPWVATHFMMGKPNHEMSYKASSWEIDPDSISKNGAYIRLKPDKGTRSFLKNGSLNRATPDKDKYYLSRDELVKFLTTAWVPAPPPADAGGMPPDAGMGGMT